MPLQCRLGGRPRRTSGKGCYPKWPRLQVFSAVILLEEPPRPSDANVAWWIFSSSHLRSYRIWKSFTHAA